MYVKSKLGICAVFYLLMSGYVQGQQGDCSSPLVQGNRGHVAGTEDNNSSICEPIEGQVYLPNEQPYVKMGTGSGSIKLKYTLTQLSGTKGNMSNPVLNEIIDTHSEMVKGCRVQLDRHVRNVCDRTGLFEIEAVIEHNAGAGLFGEVCKDEEEGVYRRRFSILPEVIGLTTPELVQTVCSGNNVRLFVDSTAPNQSGARWYTTSGQFIHDGYSYFTDINALESKTFLVSYYKTVNGVYEYRDIGSNYPNNTVVTENFSCVREGLRIPFIAIAIDLDLEVSPPPFTDILCGPGELEITLPNPNNKYSGIRWYTDPTRINLVHDGFTFNKFYSSTETFFTEYYIDRGGCEQVSAIPS